MLIDVTRAIKRALLGRLPTGVDRVTLAYIRHFYRRAEALVRFSGRWVMPGQEESKRLFDALLIPDEKSVAFLRDCTDSAYGLSCVNKKSLLLLNTGHSGLDHPEYAVQAQHWDLRPVFFLHDLIPVTHSEYCRGGEAERHRKRLATMFAAGRGLIVNSEDTLRELICYADICKMVIPPCVVAPLAPADLPQPSEQRPLQAPYFVILGTIEPRKNHLLLLHLWRRFVQELGDRTPRLVIIGQRGWECEKIIDLLEHDTDLRGQVVELPACSDADLATYLHHAQALLFPSFVEGYGMPLVEALAAGVPVLASNLSTFREIAGDIPDYIDPSDDAGWRRFILDYMLPLSSQRSAQIDRLAGFRVPTWKDHFSIVEDFLERIKILSC